MLALQGLLNNARAAAYGPRLWWLSRQSIVHRGAIQHIDELTRFMRVVKALRPRTVLEIGTAQGGLFWAFCCICPLDAMLISLDLPPSERHSGGQNIDVNLQCMNRGKQTIHVVHGNSHDQQIYSYVTKCLGARRIDLLFIDGDHSYDGVSRDYDMYGALVRPGGLIAFHDITHTDWPECQVDRFWAELSSDPTLQPTAIYSRQRSTFGGIGIVKAR
jgi:cephalosporin hydroxylase